MGNTESTMNSSLTNEVVSQKLPINITEVFAAEVGENLDLDLDQVHRSTDKLAHPAAERAKAPKRRLSSSVSMICNSCLQRLECSSFLNF